MAGIFTDPAVAFDEGNTASQNYINSFRRNQAMKALERVYGPIAGDQQALANESTVQSNAFAAADNPLKLQADQLANTGTQQTNDLNAQLNPLKVQAGQLENATTQQSLDTATSNQDVADQQRQAQLLHGAMSASLDVLGKSAAGVTDQSKLGAMWDAEVQHVAPLLGQDPRVLAAGLQQQRQQFITGGAAAIPTMQTELDGAVSAQLSPKDRAATANELLKGNLTQAQIEKTQAQTATEQAKAAAAGNGKGLTAAQQLKLQQQKSAASNALTDLHAANINVSSAIDSALKQIDASPLATGPAAQASGLLGHIGNQPAYNLAKTLDTIKSNVGFSQLQALRNASPTGGALGQVSDTEEKLLQSTIASIDQGQSADQVKANLKKIKQSLAEGEARAKEAFDSDFSDGSSASGSTTTYTYNPDTGELE